MGLLIDVVVIMLLIICQFVSIPNVFFSIVDNVITLNILCSAQVQILSFFRLREVRVVVWLVLGFETRLVVSKENKN